MAEKREHKVQVFMHGFRYIAIEAGGTVSLSKDGNHLGKARWKDDQLVNSTAPLPDDVCEEIERQIKIGMDGNWGD